MKNQRTKNTHLQFAQGNRKNQKLQESIFSPTREKLKNKKSPHSLKNKTLQTHNPTDNNGMKEQTENIKGMSLDEKEGQLVTGGIFYCRDSASFSVSASNKLLCNLTGQCFEIGNKNIPPIRYKLF